MTPGKFAEAQALKTKIESAKQELFNWEHRITSANQVFSKHEFLPDSVFQSFRHFAILSVKDAIVILERQFDEL